MSRPSRPDGSTSSSPTGAGAEPGRRFRIVLETEGIETGLPIFDAPVGSTTWGPTPGDLLDADGRAVGVITRIWREHRRERLGDLAYVWAEGTLNPGETMPYQWNNLHPGLDPRPYLTVLDVVEKGFRHVADTICTHFGATWRHQVATEMECAPQDVGISTIARREDGQRFRTGPFRNALVEVRSEDPRATARRWDLPGGWWMEGIAVPLDNPWATARAGLTADRLRRYQRDIADRAAAMRQRLDEVGQRSDPPQLDPPTL